MTQRIRGVLAPVVTPFKADLSPDRERFIAHCKWLLSQNCGLAVFGTNSEANSLAAEERSTLLDALVAAGVDTSRMMPGTGCCSITDTVKLTSQAVKHGCAGVLMLPPFYYKDVSEEGLYRHLSEVVQRVDAFGKKYPMISALKQGIAIYTNDPAWRAVRPPLIELTAEQAKTLAAELKAISFTMPGLSGAEAAAKA